MIHAARVLVFLSVVSFSVCGPAKASGPTPAEEHLGWGVGATCWSFGNFTFCESIDMAGSLGLRYLEGLQGQKLGGGLPGTLGVDMSDETIAQVKQKLDAAGMTLSSIWHEVPGDEAECGRLLDFCNKMGIKVISHEPPPEDLDAVEGLFDEYGISVGLHNHPAPSIYANPDTVLEVLKDRGKHVGACPHIGHWQRSEVPPLESVRKLQGHIVTFHLTDLKQTDGELVFVPWGTGDGNLKGILEEMARQGSKVIFNMEYGPEWNGGSAEDIRKSVVFFNEVTGDLIAKGVHKDSPLEKALAQIKTYDYGQSREPLRAVEALILDSYGNTMARKQLELRLASLLDAEVTRACKDFCCRQLAMIGTHDVVPALAKLLGQENLSHLARIALERIPGEAADAALLDALENVSNKLKVGVIHSLATRQTESAAATLQEYLSDSDPQVAAAATAALGAIATAEAAEALGAFQEKAPKQLRLAAADAYLACAQRLLADGKKAQALVIYKAISKSEQPKHVHVAAMRGLLAATGKK